MTAVHTPAAKSPAPPPGTLQTVADGCYAWIQPDGSWWINNAGAVVGGDETLIIDTCATADRTSAFLGAVRDKTRRKTRYAVNTHHHGDHTFGNCLLPSDTVLIAHEAARQSMRLDTTMSDFPGAWSPSLNLSDLTQRTPDLTVRSDLDVHVGEREVRLLHPGYPAHTRGDLVVLVPDTGVLYVGDLLFADLTPLAIAGRPSGMIRVLDWISDLAPTFVVPGHGPVVSPDRIDDVLDAHRRYFTLVLERARSGVAADASPLETARSTDLGEFSDLGEPERMVLNLHAAYAELTGRAVDRDVALADAVRYLGQPMTLHA